MDLEFLKNVQININAALEMINRETEFSPGCRRCSDERFYINARNVAQRLESILKQLEKQVGPLEKKPYPYAL
jgi:hypothetical protein